MNPIPRFVPRDFAVNRSNSGRVAGTNTRQMPLPSRSLKVAVVYDDSGAGHRALTVLDRVESESARQIRVYPVLWRFDRLDGALNRFRAADDLKDADVVVLSLTDSESMPAPVEIWFNAFLERAKGTVTLLLLFGDEEAWVVAESRTSAGVPAGR
ncbi:MAG TPA: hypothetical protein VHE61_14220 [Opitutaceae bacterium]|nr:hypothetical protein [Opitutaceae bacterium]